MLKDISLSGDMHDSLGVTEIGVIPPPPMFSSPSPPVRHILPPPKEHSQHQVTSANFEKTNKQIRNKVYTVNTK